VVNRGKQFFPFSIPGRDIGSTRNVYFRREQQRLQRERLESGGKERREKKGNPPCRFPTIYRRVRAEGGAGAGVGCSRSPGTLEKKID